MSRTRDMRKQLWAVYPSNDPDFNKWNKNYTHDDKSDKLKFTIRRNFNHKGLSKIFVDVSKRNKLKFWYKIRSIFGREELKIKVRLPKKPNIYYINRNWYKTGDYYIDPVEIWWSEHGKNVLKSWKNTCDVQSTPITNQQILDSIAEQYAEEEEIEIDVNETYGESNE